MVTLLTSLLTIQWYSTIYLTMKLNHLKFLALCMLGKFCLMQLFKLSRIPVVSNILDGDPTQNFVGPELCPNCLEMLSAGKT